MNTVLHMYRMCFIFLGILDLSFSHTGEKQAWELLLIATASLGSMLRNTASDFMGDVEEGAEVSVNHLARSWCLFVIHKAEFLPFPSLLP